MYLQRLEIHGFKSFAQKTVLEFLMPQNSKKGITAIVGPNGSGKSNVADAIRWVLGEQSLKTLRGKKSEDVIFAGSDKKSRLGVAEVSLVLNNEDGEADIEMSEVVITRRIYRDGESEYLINNHQARLQDIVLLLARARFGQKNYLVIGQGMADYILRATPAERKELLDEAAGIKELQIKRQIAFNKLESSQNNLIQAEGILKEIEPRLRYLQRQTKRLAERELVEKDLRELQKKYYGKLWQSLGLRVAEFEKQYARIDEELQRKKSEQQEILNRFKNLEEKTTASQEFLDWQKKYEAVLATRGQIQEKKFKLQNQLELLRVRAERVVGNGALAYESIIEELENLLKDQDLLISKLISAKSLEDLPVLQKLSTAAKDKTVILLNKIKNPSGTKKEFVPDPTLIKELSELDKDLQNKAREITAINQAMQELNEAEKQKKGEIFELQRVLQAKQLEVHKVEQELNSVQIELARLETKRDGLAEEISLEMGELSSEVKLQTVLSEPILPEEIQPQIFKLKHQLELIGGIDPEIVAEHKETEERFNFLSTQITDLQKAIVDVVATITDLDKVMKTKRDDAMHKINEEFNHFFQILFNGGSAKLIMIYEDPTKDEELEEDSEEKEVSQAKDLIEQTGEPILVGIDIQATPPGKRIKDINILSGGERALASVALICAILSYSPSPFVVLDEVDAALDEANTMRLAEIIDQLSARTQFIVITHNRSTMNKAQILYGVTMGDDGVSRLLSVKLAEAEKMVNRQ
ncbi:MAG TPA: AAA family ATPase [Candidatus Magasanikbacteria bacterium]|nr:AAA family ATPase [Candidatus Magasanikbacteria bacterium]